MKQSAFADERCDCFAIAKLLYSRADHAAWNADRHRFKKQTGFLAMTVSWWLLTCFECAMSIYAKM
jgi:hypothetical protein